MERYIDIPVEKEVPEWVIGHLREIHPKAELVYVDNGWWWVGIVKPEAPARAAARQALDRMPKGTPWPIKRRWLLQEQGFALCGKYRFGDEGPEWSAIVEDFRMADFIWRNWGTPNATIAAQIDETGVLDDEIRLKARAATVERLKADERYLFSRLIRQNPAPVSVGVDL